MISQNANSRPGSRSGGFEAPDEWHRPAVYWFWHSVPTGAELASQIARMAAAGIGSFQIQARLAMPLDQYLSPEYVKACRRAVDLAAEAGLMVGVYDDYNWQSGQAAGRAVAGRDDLREAHLVWATAEAADGRFDGAISGLRSSSGTLGAAGLNWHHEGGREAWTDWACQFAILEVPGAPPRDRAADVRITDSGPTGCRFTWTGAAAPAGARLTVVISARSASSRVINHLEPAAVARFIEAGYQPYADALGPHLGSTVRYLFFDQPHQNFVHWDQLGGNLRSALPCASDLPSLIRRQFQDRYPRVLLALLGRGRDRDADTSADEATAEDRVAFWRFYSDLSQTRFFGPVRDWCHAHNLALSGHEVLGHVGSWNLDGAFEQWDLRCNFGADYFGVDSWRDITAVDAQDAVPQLSAKLGDSAARAHGRGGVILEQYFAGAAGGTGTYAGHWGLLPEEMRRQSIRHHLQGMRQFLFHGFYQTDGHGRDHELFVNARFDFPPGVNYLPWFDEFFPAFAAESGRLSEFLDGAEPAAPVALMYPLTAMWLNGQWGGQARAFGAWAEFLWARGYGYRIVDEPSLARATPTGRGAFETPSGRHQVLVIPGDMPLDRPARAAVSRLEAAAVPVVRVARPTAAALARFPPGAVPGIVPGCDLTVDSAVAEHWTGRETGGPADGEPVWRVALFNPTDADAAVELGGLSRPLEIWDAATGRVAAASPRALGPNLAIRLAPQQLTLLRYGAPPTAGLPCADAAFSPGRRFDDAEWQALGGRWTLRAGTFDGPVDVTRGWERQGLPTYSGVGVYTTELHVARPAETLLWLPRVAGGSLARIGGQEVGRVGWGRHVYTIPASLLRPGDNELAIEVYGGAANSYYAGTPYQAAPEPCGLLAEPRVRPAAP
jgi:hypothetical protein